MNIDDLDTAKERYVAYRLKGHGDTKAAELAGYESGAPKEARVVYRKAKGFGGNLLKVQTKCEQEIDRLAFQLQQKRRKLCAVRAKRAIRDE